MQAAAIAGSGMAIGALIIGHRLLQTVGRQITPIDPLEAVMMELVGDSSCLVASTAGIPVSLAEIITCSVISFGCAHST